MRYIENEKEFREFMEVNGPSSPGAKSNYISWLYYISSMGISIDSSLDNKDNILDALKEMESTRKEYKRPDDYNNFGSAINKYLAFLQVYEGSVTSDIKDIESSNNSATEKEQLVKARIGQGKYRNDLIKLWRKCSVTGVDKVEFLVASHILPWKNADNVQRLNPYNGLLLLPNYDKLFDKGYISFEDDGKIILSKKFNTTFFKQFGIANTDKLSKVFDQNKEFLKVHRTLFASILYDLDSSNQ